MEQLLVLTENRDYSKDMRDILNIIVKNYFNKLITTGCEDNYSDIVIELSIEKDMEFLYAINRLTKEKKHTLAEIQYTERTFLITSKFLANENTIDFSFTFCLN